MPCTHLKWTHWITSSAVSVAIYIKDVSPSTLLVHLGLTSIEFMAVHGVGRMGKFLVAFFFLFSFFLAPFSYSLLFCIRQSGVKCENGKYGF